MKKASVTKLDDGLRPEYDLTQLKGGVRGKYYQQATAGTNLMLIEPEPAEVFWQRGIGEPRAATPGGYSRSGGRPGLPPASGA